MHGTDLNPAVTSGLGWYYLLAAMLNAGAAAYVAYMEMVSEGASRVGLRPRTRKLPDWLVIAFCTLNGLALLAIILRGMIDAPSSKLDVLTHGEARPAMALMIAYCMSAIANVMVAIAAGADAAHHAEEHSAGHGVGAEFGGPTLDDHLPAVGLGGPINRTLWTLVWGVSAVVFQAMGIVYIFNQEFGLPLFVRNAIDFVSGPTTFFLGATAAFWAMIQYRKVFANGVFAWWLVNGFLLFFGLSITDKDFRGIVTAFDNVPIVGMIILVGFFTWLGVRRAVINDSRMAQGLPNLEELEPEKTLTWPDLVYTELIAMVLQTIVLVVWAVALQAPLEQPASSTSAPNPSKAPWYFLGLQEMLVYFDPWMAGVVLPTMIIVGMMAMPYIDNNKQGNGYYTIEQRKFAYVTFQYGWLVLWVVLILLGTFLRGPNWNFFGPYEFWDVHKIIPLNNVNLSDIVWVQMFKTSRPDSYLIRETPGIIVVLMYLLLTPALLGRFVFRKYIADAGWARYMVLSVLILFMASLPIKMVLRWTINLKYLVYIPELFFNI